MVGYLSFQKLEDALKDLEQAKKVMSKYKLSIVCLIFNIKYTLKNWMLPDVLFLTIVQNVRS